MKLGNLSAAMAFFQNRDKHAASVRLRRAKDYSQRPQELNDDDFRGMLNSLQWCYINQQWQMVIDFTLFLRNYFDRRDRWREGILCIKQALKADKHLGQTGIRPQFAFELGLLLDRQGQLAKAKRYYKASAELADQADQKEILAEALHRLGWVAHNQRNYSTAETHYREAMALRDSRDTIGRFRSLHQLGMLAHDQGDYKEAGRLHLESLQLVGNRDRYLEATSLHQLGVLAVKQHYWDEAGKRFKEALDIRKQIHDLSGQATTWHELGIVNQEQDNFSVARDCYVESLKIVEKLNDVPGLIRTQMQLGALALANDDFDEAQSWLGDSLKKSHTLSEGYLEAKIRLQLGIIHYRTQEYNQALVHLRCSLDLFPEYEEIQREWASSLYQIGLIFHDQDQLEKAERYYLRSLAIQESANFQPDIAETQLQLGLLAQQREQLMEAQRYYLASYPIFRTGGPRFAFHLAQVSYFLGYIEEVSIEKAKGKREIAQTYYQEALHLYQSLTLPDIELLIETVEDALKRVSQG